MSSSQSQPVLAHGQTSSEPSAALRPFWVSWWRDLSLGFELHSPWWESGYRYAGADMLEQASICAAVMAEDENDAERRVIAAHDREPHYLEFRFSNERPADWSPFCDRFQRADWMIWPAPVDGKAGTSSPSRVPGGSKP